MLPHKENILLVKVERFTDRIIKLIKYIKAKGADDFMVIQIGKSGTSIGANINEGIYAQSRLDFVSKYSIALKEANETSFWLRKLRVSEILSDVEFNSINKDCDEIIFLLIAIIKKTKENSARN